MDSALTIKKPEQLKQKAQAPIGQVGRVHTNAKVSNQRPGDAFKLSPAKFDGVPLASRAKHLWEWINSAMLRNQQNLNKDPIVYKV